jgi:hypothetical protein
MNSESTLKWKDLKSGLEKINDPDVLKTTVRCQEHHHFRLLKFYPRVFKEEEKIFLTLIWPTIFRGHVYSKIENELRRRYGTNSYLLLKDLKEYVTSITDESLLNSSVICRALGEEGQPDEFLELNTDIQTVLDFTEDQEDKDGYLKSEDPFDDYALEHEHQIVLSLTV